MSSFTEAMNQIKTEYFTPEEFPLVDRARFPRGVLKKLMSIPTDKLSGEISSIKSAELEGMLLDLADTKKDEEAEIAATVLCLKNSNRLYGLLRLLIQYRYRSRGLKGACVHIWKHCPSELSEDLFWSRFANAKDLVATLRDLFLKEDGKLGEVCSRYGILTESPLAQASMLSYFAGCEKVGFIKNTDQMIKILQSVDSEKLFFMIKNYLKKLSLVEFDDQINLIIGERYGSPYESAAWQTFPIALRDKYVQWSYLYQLKTHCEKYPRKYHILMKYFEHVRSSSLIENTDVLLMDFGWIVVADPHEREESFLYERDYFEREMKQWKNDENFVPIFLRPARNILTAREFMLSADDAPCILLNYEDIQHYYAEEVLDIKIGLEPDDRKQKTKRSI